MDKKYVVFNRNIGNLPTVRIKVVTTDIRQEIERLLILDSYGIAICDSWTEAKAIEFQNRRALGLPTEQLVAHVK